MSVVDIDAPRTDASQVIIEVHAAGVTFPDVLLTRGEYQMKPGLPFVPGSEVAGVVKSAPTGSPFTAGQRVAAFCGFGGFAEQVAVPPHVVFPLSERHSFAQGAALPMNVLTVHFGLTRRGRLRSGETVLVHGAAGGIGTAAIQLACAMGARVIAVVSSPDKEDVAKSAGAHDVVAATGFREAVSKLTKGRGVDVIVDPVGGDRFTDSLRSLATEGRLLVIGFTGGEIPTVKVNRLLLNNVEVIGVGWGAFWMARPHYLQEQWAELGPHLASGALDPIIGATYSLDRASEALRELSDRKVRGKVILAVR